jgi:hypothetical protein
MLTTKSESYSSGIFRLFTERDKSENTARAFVKKLLPEERATIEVGI